VQHFAYDHSDSTNYSSLYTLVDYAVEKVGSSSSTCAKYSIVDSELVKYTRDHSHSITFEISIPEINKVFKFLSAPTSTSTPPSYN
jgi:hypothetical protein